MPEAVPEALAVQRAYELALWLLPKVEKFGRGYRFTVGDRIASAVLDLLETLAAAAYDRNKTPLLSAAIANVNGLRYLLRLAKDLRLLSIGNYGFAAESLDELGRMIGGWKKQVERK